MSVDVYKKAAIEALARLGDKRPAVVAVTSSCAVLDSSSSAEGLAKALAGFEEGAALAGEEEAKAAAGCKSAGEAAAALEKMMAKRPLTLLALPCILESEAVMLLTAQAGSVIFVERRGISRSDQIEKALEAVKNLGAQTVGFLLE